MLSARSLVTVVGAAKPLLFECLSRSVAQRTPCVSSSNQTLEVASGANHPMLRIWLKYTGDGLLYLVAVVAVISMIEYFVKFSRRIDLFQEDAGE